MKSRQPVTYLYIVDIGKRYKLLLLFMLIKVPQPLLGTMWEGRAPSGNLQGLVLTGRKENLNAELR